LTATRGASNNIGAVRRALESAGVIFVEENGAGPGVRLMKRNTIENWRDASPMPIGSRVIATSGDTDAFGKLSELGFHAEHAGGNKMVMRRDLRPVSTIPLDKLNASNDER
jgi:hypothetical protein